jgi:hypothetical protein
LGIRTRILNTSATGMSQNPESAKDPISVHGLPREQMLPNGKCRRRASLCFWSIGSASFSMLPGGCRFYTGMVCAENKALQGWNLSAATDAGMKGRSI